MTPAAPADPTAPGITERTADATSLERARPTPAALASLLPAWGRPLLLASAGGVLAEVVLGGGHGGGSWLGLGVLAGGWCWLARQRLDRSQLQRPMTVRSWTERCESLLTQFESLESDPERQASRVDALQRQLAHASREELRLALVSSGPLAPSQLAALQASLRGSLPLRVLVSDPLPSQSSHWRWSDPFVDSDAVLFHLRPPLMAAELRWLEALPKQLPLWLLLETNDQPTSASRLAELRSQWPAADPERILAWDGRGEALGASLAPLCQWLSREGGQLPPNTLCRCLDDLHGLWQGDLERLRRARWQQLQQRTQWLVAAAVLVTPAMSLDLLVLSVANGLMLREMAHLWGSPWSLEQLKAAALEVGKAALALGVMEWGVQACAAAFQLHGTTWLVGGGLQALSAAYLTRVIGHAMADLLARNVGVREPDLAAIKAEAPLLVAKAAEAERLDWGAFVREARSWLSQREALGSQPEGA